MTFPLDQQQLLRRAHGCLLVAACADLIAAPLNGRTVPDPAQVEVILRASPRLLQPSPAALQMTVLAEHLAAHDGRVNDDGLASELAKQWPDDRPDLAGSGTARVLGAVSAGTRWWQVAPKIHHGAGSFGSVAAVRACAAGLVPGTGIAAAAALGRRSAGITHTHLLARDGAAATATAVALAVRSQPGAPADKYRFLSAVAAQMRTAEFRSALRTVQTLVRHRSAPAETAATLGADRTALRSVPAALTAFLRHPDEPTAAIRYALMMGGQTQTTAAIVGAISGARHPEHTVAMPWRPDVVRLLRLRATAAGLSAIPGRGGSRTAGRHHEGQS
ncbi:ADP-ribosylglycohydrolase family protein [Catellatospora coxensis]|uniref:ADP-ribosylglycohydrolase n=1 Tax=Catellatospora coxensis TaxID=310354 RepID=A0A8J3P6L6_9ACTN|nr:ADP-ribosylglycohydrolase family protein [Catellatospora coxensis]GIG05642.1 ADP-ribosylglycohydrolase [Catellatospora coxensis]